MDKINIASALNEDYVPYTYTMLYSLLENHKEETRVRVFLLCNDLREDSKKKLEDLAKNYDSEIVFLTPDSSAFDSKMLEQGEWSIETLYRLQLFDLLPGNVDRILYLDGDMIINRDISQLYGMDFASSHLIVTHDMTMTPESGPVYGHLHSEHFNQMIRENRYFNAGMILMDARYLKEHYNLESYLRRAEELDFDIFAPDQDLLNDLHQDECKYIDALEYDLFACNAAGNGISYEKMKKDTVIVHYVGDKPWNAGDHLPYREEMLWWDYASRTIYAEEFLNQYLKDMISRSELYEAIQSVIDENAKIKRMIEDTLELTRKTLSMNSEKKSEDKKSEDKGSGEKESAGKISSSKDGGSSQREDIVPGFLPKGGIEEYLDQESHDDLDRDAVLELIREYLLEDMMHDYIERLREENADLKLAWQTVQKQFAAIGEGMGVTE